MRRSDYERLVELFTKEHAKDPDNRAVNSALLHLQEISNSGELIEDASELHLPKRDSFLAQLKSF